MADFVWGSGGRQLTPDEIAAERKYSQSLMQQASSTAPVGHWTQGLNRVLQGLLAGYAGYEADQATKRNETFTSDAVAKALASFDGGASTSASMPATTSAPVASPVPMAPATGGAPQSYFDAVKMAESSGNPAATNPNSSATGLYQFTAPTWNDLMRNRPELGLTPDGRLDPQQQERAMRAFTDQNAGVLSGAGIEALPANLYAAHFLGAGGARSVLGLPDNTPMMAAAGPEVVKANPFLANMTVGDFKNWAGQKVGGAVAPGAAPQIVDANQPSPLDTAQWPAGPGGAPMDSAAIPPNARPTQGQLPAAGNFPLMAASTPSMPASASPGMPAIAQSAGRPAIHPEILKLMSSPYVSDTGRKIGALLFQGQMQSRGAELKAARELQARSSAAAQAGIDPRMASDPEIWKQAVAAQFGAPATATVGHDLINTRNGQPIYRGQADAPTSVSEYGFYADQEKAQGRQPLPYGQWDTARKKAGATSVPIQLGTQAPDGRLREKLERDGSRLNRLRIPKSGCF